MSELLQKYCKAWDLMPTGKSLETHSSHLYYVKQGAAPAVLKIFKPNSDEVTSAKVLMSYAGSGAVKVLAGSEEAILLEEVLPGETLTELVVAGNDDAATEIFCEVAGKLHAASFEPDLVAPIDNLKGVFNRYLASEDDTLARDQVMRGQRIFLELAATQTSHVLLHGDLHHENILHDANHGWVAIDPKGYIGEREFEVAQFLKNPKNPTYCADEDITNRRIALISEALNMDAQRILGWAYSAYIISCIWGVEDGVFEEHWRPLLAVLERLITHHRG